MISKFPSTRPSMDKSEYGDATDVTWRVDTEIALRKWWVFQNIISSMLVLIIEIIHYQIT